MVIIIAALLAQPYNLNLQPPSFYACSGSVSCSRAGPWLYISGSGSGGSGAPVDGGYVVWTSVGSTNERILTAGTNVTIDTSTPGQIIVNSSGGGSSSFDGGYSLVQDDGVDLTKRSTVDFTGSGVTCTDTGSKTSCDIPGGGGSGSSPLSISLGTP